MGVGVNRNKTLDGWIEEQTIRQVDTERERDERMDG
jgi:hypothetical protein